MKVAALFVISLYLIANLQAASVLPTFPAPAFFWSGERYFVGKDEQTLQTLSENDITDLVSSIVGVATPQSTLVNFVNKDASKPEIVVVWVENQAKPDRAAYSFVQPLLDGSASSLVAPYTYPRFAVSQAVINQAKASKVVSSAEAALNYLDENKAILSDGKVDLLVVYLSPDQVSLISPVEAKIKEQTNAYVFILTADSVYQPQKETTMHVRSVAVEDEMDFSVQSVSYSDGDYWPSSVWSGIIISVTLLVLLGLGVGCLFELQTPTRWEKTKRTIREVN